MDFERYKTDKDLIVKIKTQDTILYFPKCLLTHNMELIKMLDQHHQANELDLSNFDNSTVTYLLYYIETKRILCKTIEEFMFFCQLADYLLLDFNCYIIEAYLMQFSINLKLSLIFINNKSLIDQYVDSLSTEQPKNIDFGKYGYNHPSWHDLIDMLKTPISRLQKIYNVMKNIDIIISALIKIYTKISLYYLGGSNDTIENLITERDKWLIEKQEYVIQYKNITI